VSEDTIPGGCGGSIKPFKPGHKKVGGREEGTPNVKTILNKFLSLEDEDNPDITNLEDICLKHIKLAKESRLDAIKEVYDRLDGKATQHVDQNINVRTTKDIIDELDATD